MPVHTNRALDAKEEFGYGAKGLIFGLNGSKFGFAGWYVRGFVCEIMPSVQHSNTNHTSADPSFIPELELWEIGDPKPFTLESLRSLGSLSLDDCLAVKAMHALSAHAHDFSTSKLLCQKAKEALEFFDAHQDKMPPVGTFIQEDRHKDARRIAVLIEFFTNPQAQRDILAISELENPDVILRKVLSASSDLMLPAMFSRLSHAAQGGEINEVALDKVDTTRAKQYLCPHEKHFNIVELAELLRDNIAIEDGYALQRLVIEIIRQSDSSALYFHGTNSWSLPGIIKAGGLRPVGQQQTLGIDTPAGEKRAGVVNAGPNQFLLSATSGTHPYVPVEYAMTGPADLVRSPEELERAKQFAARYFPDLGELLPKLLESSFRKYEAMLKDNPYPVMIGITNTKASLPQVALRLRGERHLPPVDIDRLIFFVPPNHMQETRDLFASAGLVSARVESIFLYDQYIMLADRADVRLETAYRLSQGVAEHDFR